MGAAHSICTSDTGHEVDPVTRPEPNRLTAQERGTISLAKTLALRGKQVSRTEFISHDLPYCDGPIRLGRRVSAKKHTPSLEVSMNVPCRRCAKCLQYRQMKWRQRAMAELARAPRTWWITLTFSPTHLAGVLAAAASSDKDTLERRIDDAAYRHVQRYLKRLRRAYKRKLRYLAVFERGERTGRAHYHMLLHEVDGPILKQWIETQWPSQVRARLVATGKFGVAGYVTKYATKGLAVRVRASARYGRLPPSRGTGDRGGQRVVQRQRAPTPMQVSGT